MTDDTTDTVQVHATPDGVLSFTAERHTTVPALLEGLGQVDGAEVEYSVIEWAGPYEVLAVINGTIGSATGIGALVLTYLRGRVTGDRKVRLRVTAADGRVIDVEHDTDLSIDDRAAIEALIDRSIGQLEGRTYGPAAPIVSSRPDAD